MVALKNSSMKRFSIMKFPHDEKNAKPLKEFSLALARALLCLWASLFAIGFSGLSFTYEPLNNLSFLLSHLLPCSFFVEAFFRKESVVRTVMLVLTGATGILSTFLLLFSLFYYGELDYLLHGKEPAEGPQSAILQEVSPTSQSHKIVLKRTDFMEVIDPSSRWSIELYFIRPYGSFLQERKRVCTVRPANEAELRISKDRKSVRLTVTPYLGYGEEALEFDIPTSWNDVKCRDVVLSKTH